MFDIDGISPVIILSNYKNIFHKFISFGALKAIFYFELFIFQTLWNIIWKTTIWYYIYQCSGFPIGASGKETACQFKRYKRHGLDPLVGEITWRRKCQPTPIFLPGESHGQRSLTGYKLQGRKSRTQLSDWTTNINVQFKEVLLWNRLPVMPWCWMCSNNWHQFLLTLAFSHFKWRSLYRKVNDYYRWREADFIAIVH